MRIDGVKVGRLSDYENWMPHCVIGEDVFLATNQENGLKVLDAASVVQIQYFFCSVRGSASVRGQDRES